MKGRYFAILLISAVLFGCVSTDIDKSADFSKLKTFSWGESDIDSDHPAYSGELIEKKIRSTIREEFNRKDIAYNPDDPDFLVHYYTHTEKKQEDRYVRSYPYGVYHPYFFHPWAWMYGYPFMAYPYRERVEFTEGTFIIDVEDTATGEVIWRGSVSAKLESGRNPARQIEKGVRAIIRRYPGTPGETEPALKLPDKDAVS